MNERASLRAAARAASLASAALLAALGAGGCGAPAGARATAGEEAAPAAASAGAELVAEHGTLRPRALLTGELRAARAQDVVIPRSPTWQMQIRWMAEDGTRVRRGEKVLELENDEFARALEDKRLEAAQKAEELVRLRAEAELAEAEARFAVRQKQAELAKAELAAAVPPELVSAHDYQQAQLARERAAVDLAKAEEELAAARRAGAADVEVAAIELAGARREIEVAEQARGALSLEAPGDGILIHEEHPWEGRTLQVGDTVWVGFTVMRIPDLTSMMVEAELPDVDDGEVAPGMAARCTLDAHPDLVFPGRVTEVSPIARRDEGRGLRRHFRVRIGLDGGDPERMRPGMSVKVEVLGEPAAAGLLVPRAALDLEADPPRVRLAGGGWRRVRVAACDAQRCAVEAADGEALAAGERLARAPRPEPDGGPGPAPAAQPSTLAPSAPEPATPEQGVAG